MAHLVLSTEELVHAFLDDLAHLRMEVFAEYPYLYDGATYVRAETSFMALVVEGDEIVGASTAVGAWEEEPHIQTPPRAWGIAPEHACYFGESVLRASYRGRGWGRRFFEVREAYAREINAVWAVFCAVVRPEDHPERPQEWSPLEPFWRRLGYEVLEGCVGT